MPQPHLEPVFTVIDRLNREGAVTLTPKGGGHYSVHTADQVSLIPLPAKIA